MKSNRETITCRNKGKTYTRKAVINTRPDGRRYAEVKRGNWSSAGCSVTTYIEASDGLWDLSC